MNGQSYKATFKATGEECVAIGDFTFDAERKHLYIVLPNAKGEFNLDAAGRAALDAIQISRTPAGCSNRIWLWDGNETSPTLNPSIHWLGHWHGYLINGVLKSC